MRQTGGDIHMKLYINVKVNMHRDAGLRQKTIQQEVIKGIKTV